MKRQLGRLVLAAALIGAGVLPVASCDLLFPGPGDFEPSGTEFRLNADIELISVTGKNQGFPGTGTYPLEMKVRSKSSGLRTDTLPAGLLFRSVQSGVQHVLVLKPQVVVCGTSPASCELGVFCCNEHRHMPRASDTFELGPITDNPGLEEIIGLVRDKDISGSLWMVQRAVWMLTDSTGLTQAYRDSLGELPPGARNQGSKGPRHQTNARRPPPLRPFIPLSLVGR